MSEIDQLKQQLEAKDKTISALMNRVENLTNSAGELHTLFEKSISLQRELETQKKSHGELKEFNRRLEEEVSKRTTELKNKNKELEDTLVHLQESKDNLQTQYEKIAMLGTLIASVTHEINNLIGVCITANSHFDEEINTIEKKINDNSLKKSDLTGFLEKASEVSSLNLSNLKRTSELVKGFKTISVDQTSEQLRNFRMEELISNLTKAFHNKLKKSKHTLTVECDSELNITSYPGALFQVLANLLFNALIHAFDEEESGVITIIVSTEHKDVLIEFKDNGKGIDKDTQDKIFEPFYTTRSNEGGSGLGLYICKNLVEKSLNGSFTFDSMAGKGTSFFIRIPKEIV